VTVDSSVQCCSYVETSQTRPIQDESNSMRCEVFLIYLF